MRLAVIVFSLVLLFAQTYAHAILFVPAVSGALIRTSAGQFIKVASKKAFAGAIIGASAKVVNDYCKKNSSKCKDILGDVAEYFFEDDDESPDDYRQCFDSSNKYKSANPQQVCDDWLAQANSRNTRSYVFADSVVAKFSSTANTDGYCAVYGGTSKFNGNSGTTFRCTDLSDAEKLQKKEEKEQVKKEQIQKIVNNLSDDDITYIINNYGDEIDVDRYCSENSCDELSNEFGQEVQNNQNKYDIDQINKQNCVVKNGKIVSCDNAKIEQDEETEETTEENTEQETEETTEDKKINCEASEFHKKVCDFIDWYQDDFEHDNTDTGVNVDDKSDDLPKHKDYIKFNAQCPPDKIINLSFAGVSKSLNWTYQDFCHAMIELKPFVVGFSIITGAFIIAGRRV